MFLRFSAILLFLSFAGLASAEEGDALFVRRVWPLFQEKCLACHGKDPAKIKAGFDMRTLTATLKGGESGESALKPGSLAESPLYLAITRTHEDWKAMPPKENDKLTAEQAGWVKRWIETGAAWPDEERRAEIAKASAEQWSVEDGVIVQTTGALSPEWASRRYKPEGLWAYQPVRKPPLSKGASIDALIAAKWPAGVHPAPRADRRTLLRRATFDLLGLPPSPEEVKSFESDPLPDDKAFEKVIDRLLESPHYGEQWARHWLDVVRYADSSGFANDYERGNAWRYRDYVVRAFNNDKPYDQFIKEQIAGDELDAKNSECLVATGFLRMGPWELTAMEVAKIARQRFLDDVTNSVGETFLAQSLQCCRCHDHKFDPLPTHDYYSIQACFATTQLSERSAPFLSNENLAGFDEQGSIETRRAEHEAILRRLDEKSLKAADAWFAEKQIDRSAWDQALAQLRASPNAAKGKGKRTFFTLFDAARLQLSQKGVAEDQYPPKQIGFTTEDFGQERVARKGLERLQWELDRYEPYAFAVYDGRTPEMKSVFAPLRIPKDHLNQGELEETAILGGGDPFSPTSKVQPSILSVIPAFNPRASASLPTSIGGRRAALADWIANKENPLTTRSIVNRIWLWHFGSAIAGNPNNFGSTGKKPTNPELLDWLAAAFVEKGWSFKAMHRLIMTSAAYQRSAQAVDDSKLSREDLETACAVFRPRRLTAEELRDASLTITGELNPTLGGIPNRPEINIEVAMQPRQVMGTFASAWVPNPLPSQRHRRSLYALKIRGMRDPFMEVFNEPAPDFSCERRDVSTVTPQVFSLFNSQASSARALALAHRVLQENPASPMDNLFLRVLGRMPTQDEVQSCKAHWALMTEKQSHLHFARSKPPLAVKRDAVEENTGEKFSFEEKLPGYAEFVPDLQPADVDASTRALADVCLVLLNSNEFVYLY